MKAKTSTDQTMEQYQAKHRARRAEVLLDLASADIGEAETQLSFTPLPADVRKAVADAHRQLRVAAAKVRVFVERLPPKEFP